MSHVDLQENGAAPVTPSAIQASELIFLQSRTQARSSMPRALETDEIPELVEDYPNAARHAMKAGFDSVEVRAANSYLLDQFIRDSTNKRTDRYGGSVENRIRFPIEVVNAIWEIWAADRVGVRLSPLTRAVGDAPLDSAPQATCGYLAQPSLGHLHCIEGQTRGRTQRRRRRLHRLQDAGRGGRCLVARRRSGGMLNKAFDAQCAAVQVHCTREPERRGRSLTLFSLALGSFCIGTSEFASMGILQLFSASLGIGIPTATDAITAYAYGVVIGAPLVTLTAARLNRRTLLLGLMGLFVLGNVLSATATGLGMLALARFISGMPQGAYFGAGAVVASYVVGPGHGGKAFTLVMTGLTVATILGSPLATFLGQTLGWRNTYLAVACIAALAFLALWCWVPRTETLHGGPVVQELSALRKPAVWAMMLVAAFGVASIFAVYTFIGPFVTDVAALDRTSIPIALALFGLGMTAGNLVGGRLADAHPARGVIVGFGGGLVVLALLAVGGNSAWILMPTLFGVGTTMMIAIPTIQVRLTRLAPEAPTLMGAMNLAALNVANGFGAAAGGLTIAAGYGLLSAVWAGFGLTLAGLVVFALTLRKAPQLTSE
jgi:MFS transporter, DHA1 family, inner membrane transport protein